MSRAFKFEPAKREALPLLIGIVGPSGSGKTYSALRLATGIARESGAKIAVLDTESGRAKWYADEFKFDHCDFGPPFDPLEYLAAVQQAQAAGAGVIVIDSMSHEHEGPGGVLETHDKIAQEMADRYKGSPDAYNFPAWAKPKAGRRRFINTILQMPVTIIMCFRAKEKIKMPSRGEKKPIDLGWQPIGGEDIFFELGACFLLRPGANGVPSYEAERETAEGAVIKTPKPFRPFLLPARQLDEQAGADMARWASGGLVGQASALPAVPLAPAPSRAPVQGFRRPAPKSDVGPGPGAVVTIARYDAAEDTAEVELIDAEIAGMSLGIGDSARVKIARAEAVARIKGAS